MNSHRILLTILFLLCCGLASSQTGNFLFDGINRTYQYHLPAGYNPAISYPLVFNLHGAGSAGWQQELYSGMSDIADNEGFIVCYPDGVGNVWNAGFDIGGSSLDDVGFINALLDTLQNNLNVNPQRIYACGISNGGFMSYRIACELAHRFAAIASVAGQMPVNVANNCLTERAFPVFHLHGTSDNVVSWEASEDWLSVDSSISWWTNHNGCVANPDYAQLPDVVSEGSDIESFHYTSCDEETEVLLYKINNGGHSWPGGFDVPFVGITNKDINASQDIWDFFNQFELETVLTEVVIPNNQEWDLTAIPSLFHNSLTITYKENKLMKIEAWDMLGVKLFEKTVMAAEGEAFTLPTEHWEKGLYLIRMESRDRITTQKVQKY